MNEPRTPTWRYWSCEHYQRAGINIDFEDGCHGTVRFCPKHGGVFWDVSWDDQDRLTVAPSIRTTKRLPTGDHEHHGFIEGGEWVEA